MKKVHLLAAALVIALLAGCASQQKPMYYWGNYSHTLYEYKKHPSDESFSEHMKCLDDVIKVSKENNLRVPPGVYAEYGYYMLEMGKNEEAVGYFRLEEQAYPESTQLMERLINSVNGKEQ
jgi:hypothetical protein